MPFICAARHRSHPPPHPCQPAPSETLICVAPHRSHPPPSTPANLPLAKPLFSSHRTAPTHLPHPCQPSLMFVAPHRSHTSPPPTSPNTFI